MGSLLEWPLLSDKYEIQDTVHGTITIFHPLDLVIDTREFQRLRDIKQLGVAYLVYPCSTHSRFEHSLGLFHLATQFFTASEDEHLISLISLIWVKVHCSEYFWSIYNGCFYFQYKSLSIRLLQRIVKKEEVRKALERYFGTGADFDESNENMTFIEKLISSERFDANGKWLPGDRPVEKAFLYDIVANENDSCDVGKFDYLIRDSLSAGIPIPFNQRSIKQLMENARVLSDPERGFPRICYPEKIADVVLSIGDSRQKLHNLLYRHRVVRAIEEMVVRALRLADRHLRYMGDDGRFYSLSEMPQNLGAFIKTSDSILKEIANSTLPEMAEAQNILRDIEERNLPVKLDEVQCGSSWVDKPHASFMGKTPKLRDVEARLFFNALLFPIDMRSCYNSRGA
ncbi:unnamed protein product [Haemonchus placei]|uniref:DNA helicase n=1 Tax=Haemonchus placei TaxID=6290 RepID=A0A158QNJ0_HAEPC|nr:unnamed protein product [Haemonchus placei]